LPPHVGTALVARLDGEVVGSAALEHYRDAALLRSVAVAPSIQGRGLGCRLTEAALQLARDLGVTRVYLLTETAAEFFPRFGFGVVDRAQVPPAVRRSAEFTSACPESALAMMLKLE
jgi:amino-acid N-acetyltransferase